MKNSKLRQLKTYFLLTILSLVFVSCSDDNKVPVANNVTLQFNNTFGNNTIVLGDATSTSVTINTSGEGQVHHFSELKYVISNIRLINAKGEEFPYNVNNLDTGATVVNQAKTETLQYILSNIPTAEYTKIKFGLGVQISLNTLDETRFPNFYTNAGANDTEMHWEWGTGYRFTKIEGFYDTDNKELSIHTGSTVEGTKGDESTYTQGVDAYRDITLSLPANTVVGINAPTITIKADFNHLLSGTNKITLGDGNATPSIHTAKNMKIFVDNIGGNGTTDIAGMFSVSSVK